MDWFKKHADMIVILTAFASSVFWMNSQFREISKEMDDRFSAIEKDIAIIKTVLIMKQIMPCELAKADQAK